MNNALFQIVHCDRNKRILIHTYRKAHDSKMLTTPAWTSGVMLRYFGTAVFHSHQHTSYLWPPQSIPGCWCEIAKVGVPRACSHASSICCPEHCFPLPQPHRENFNSQHKLWPLLVWTEPQDREAKAAKLSLAGKVTALLPSRKHHLLF